jgi:ubiquinone/menaquinone biosynthesis C-methylase UbiE
MSEVQQQVREFYDQVGWKLVGEDLYQNARYEDLRPVSREYIHRCHLRVRRHLPASGRLLLDAGSGPIQYPEYLEYSRDHQLRVCADISITALLEARRRIGEKGLFVVCDITRLPFKPEVFDGVVSMHTIHHLPESEQPTAFLELYRVLTPGNNAVVVNGWGSSPFMSFISPLVSFGNRIRSVSRRFSNFSVREKKRSKPPIETNPKNNSRNSQDRKRTSDRKYSSARKYSSDYPQTPNEDQPKGTFSRHLTPRWLKDNVAGDIPIEILVWRSVNVRFLRALIHPWLAGKYWLRLLYWLEEKYPHQFGEKGQYPLIVLTKKVSNRKDPSTQKYPSDMPDRSVQ